MRIRKDPVTRNEYIRAGDVWVRNFTLPTSKPIDANDLFDEEEKRLVVENEMQNMTSGHSNIADEQIRFRNVVILSDGYNFSEHQDLLRSIPNDVSIIAVNKAVAKWTITPDRRIVNVYLVNNPFDSCATYINRKYAPNCIASVRTSSTFVKNYKGNIYFYQPVQDRRFGIPRPQRYYLDDYRNPICAAIGLAYRFNVEKLMLLGCDDSFEGERSGAVRLENGLWTYPQHLRSHEIIDANLYWLKNTEDRSVKVAHFSDGPKYKNAAYIKDEQDALNFFSSATIEAGGFSGSSQ